MENGGRLVIDGIEIASTNMFAEILFPPMNPLIPETRRGSTRVEKTCHVEKADRSRSGRARSVARVIKRGPPGLIMLWPAHLAALVWLQPSCVPRAASEWARAAVSMEATISREGMGIHERGAVEVATGLNAAKWKQAVNAARSAGVSAVRVRHILVNSDELAQMLWQQLKDGAEFDELARAISACPSTRQKGGEVGWVGAEDAHLDEILPAPVRQQCIGMKPGDTAIVESALGVHLIRVEDVFQELNVRAKARKGRRLPGTGAAPRPLVELLRKNRRSGAVSADDDAAPLRYSMDSMGCQMNTADAERMEGQLRALGFSRTEEPKDAQVIVVNTCSIRDHAEQKVYSYLGPHAIRKRKGEDLAIVVAGCVAQQEGEALLRRVPEIDLVMGPQYANRIGDLLEGVFNGNQVVATAPTHIMEDLTQPQRGSATCAWVNVIYGSELT